MDNSPFDELLSRCPPFVTRDVIEKETGGLLKSRHLANLDSMGKGIPGLFYCGGKAVYPTLNFVDFLKSRSRCKNGGPHETK